ncbi:MAG: polysaccharide deacetylase family protein [Actinomycetota bacterium]|nr:polysaccharide deacetylase family protein [Actinomycetota bacterium]
MRRRTVLAMLAGSVAAAVSACTANPAQPSDEPSPTSTSPDGAPGAATPAPARRVFGPPTGAVKVPVPRGTLSKLPGTGQRLALTVDDGTDSTVVAAYARLAQETGLRLTFFANGVNRSWTTNAPVLRPLVDAGQVFIANHTWSHPDLTKIDSARVAEEIRRNETFLTNTFGVTGRPFLRPPYGYHNATLDKQLADLGYPAVTMWLGSLGDSAVLPPATIVSEAEQWLLPEHLVIGHANHPGVIQAMDQIVQLIQQRNLVPVHLGDVFQT